MRSRIMWIIGSILLLAFAIFCCLYFIPKTTPIDITLDTVKSDYDHNELGTVQIHVQGALKEYLFHPDTLTLNIDDFDFLYDIRPWANRNSDGSYLDFEVNWDSRGYTNCSFYASSTVTGEDSVYIIFFLRKDLKKWEFLLGPSFYAEEAVRKDPTMELAYRATIE